MSLTMTIEVPVTFQRLGRGSLKELDSGVEVARLSPNCVDSSSLRNVVQRASCAHE